MVNCHDHGAAHDDLERRTDLGTGRRALALANVQRILDDEGDRLVIRPAPDDPVAATRGVFAPEFASGPTVAELMAERREEEAEIDDRRHGHGPAA